MKVKNNKKTTLSLSNYCSLYIEKFNTLQLTRSWQRKAAFAAATATVATSMFLGGTSTSLAQGITCAPEYRPAPGGLPITNPGAIESNLGYARPHLVDYDGDGDFDLMVGEKSGRELAYYQNTGTSAAPIWSAAVNNPNGLNLAAGETGTAPFFVDIDGDGDLDAFMGTEFDGLAFFRNIGTRTAPNYAAPVTNPFGLNTGFDSYLTPTFADIDNDGDFDLITGEFSGRARFYRNTGTATAPAFGAMQNNPFGLIDVGFSSAPSFADLDGDGDFDLMIGEDNGTFNYFQNTGTRTAPAYAAVVANPFELTPVSYAAPTFADIDADGDLDMFVGDANGNSILFTNSGSATQADFFSTPLNLPLVGSYTSPALADIDGDGDLDAFIGDVTGAITFAENIAAPGDIANYGPSSVLLTVPATFVIPTLADMDGDGDIDMLVGGNDGDYYYYRNDGNATTPNFVLQGTNPFGLSNVGGYAGPTLVDFDGDGDMDIFTGSIAIQGVAYFQNTGTASAPNFAAPVTNPFGIAGVGSYARTTFGDIDNDGDLDMFVGEKNGLLTANLAFYANNGTATQANFADPIDFPFGIQDTNNTWYDPSLADINNDGVLDLFLGQKEEGLVNVYINNKLYPTISIGGSGNFNDCNVEQIEATIGNYLPTDVTVTWYNNLTNTPVASGVEFNPEDLQFRGSYYAVVATADGCTGKSSTLSYEPVTPPSTFTLSGQAGYNAVTLNWERNGECDATVREYEVYADPGEFGSYFLLGFSSTASYEAVGLVNGEKVAFKIRPIYTNGTYGLYSNTVTLKPSIILGEEANEKAGFAFFPNPNNGEFNLRLQDGSASATVSVTSLSGQRVYTTTLNATQTSINLGNIASGMYIVRVETAQGTYQQKVSVVR